LLIAFSLAGWLSVTLAVSPSRSSSTRSVIGASSSAGADRVAPAAPGGSGGHLGKRGPARQPRPACTGRGAAPGARAPTRDRSSPGTAPLANASGACSGAKECGDQPPSSACAREGTASLIVAKRGRSSTTSSQGSWLEVHT